MTLQVEQFSRSFVLLQKLQRGVSDMTGAARYLTRCKNGRPKIAKPKQGPRDFLPYTDCGSEDELWQECLTTDKSTCRSA